MIAAMEADYKAALFHFADSAQYRAQRVSGASIPAAASIKRYASNEPNAHISRRSTATHAFRLLDYGLPRDADDSAGARAALMARQHKPLNGASRRFRR